MTRLGRDGTELPDDDDTTPVHRCVEGWLDRDADQPRPCPTCRPWLIERRRPRPDELARLADHAALS